MHILLAVLVDGEVGAELNVEKGVGGEQTFAVDVGLDCSVPSLTDDDDVVGDVLCWNGLAVNS